MKKKYILIIISMSLCILFGFTLFLFNAQKRVKISDFNEEEQPKITFVSSWGSYDTKVSRIQEIFSKIMNRTPGIQLENASMSGEDFLLILKTDFANGRDPDIFGLWPGSDFNLLVNQGKVADLTDILKADPEWYARFKPENWRYVTVNGRIYGLPIEMIYEGLFINKDLFEQYHVKVPTCYDELLTAVKVFKDHGIIPIAYSQTSEGSYVYQNMVMKLGGKEDVEQPFDAKGKIKPCYIQAMYYMQELYKAGAFPEQLYDMDDKDRNELFIQKKAAMIVQGSWFIGNGALGADNESVEIVPFPDMPQGKADSSAIIYGCGNGIFHMSKKAFQDPRLKEQCLNVLKQMTAPDNVAIFARDSGFISNVDLGENTPEETIMGKKGKNFVANAKECVGAVDWFINRNIWEDVIIAKFPDMLKGKITPEQIFKEVEEKEQAIEKEEVGES